MASSLLKDNQATVRAAWILGGCAVIAAAIGTANTLIESWLGAPNRSPQGQAIYTGEDSDSRAADWVTLEPTRQAVTEEKFAQLDPTRFIIEKDFGVAFKRSSIDLDVAYLDELPPLSEAFLQPQTKIFSIDRLFRRPAQVLSVTAAPAHSVEIGMHSRVNGNRVGQNWLADPAYLEILAWGIMNPFFGPEIRRPKVPLDQARVLAKELQIKSALDMQRFIEDNTPIETSVQSGVYVQSIDTDSSLLVDAIRPGLTPLERARLALRNYVGGAYREFYDRDLGIHSFAARLQLDDVLVDGSAASLLVNQAGFILGGEESAAIVVLVFPGMDEVTVLDRLKDVLSTLRLEIP